MKAADGAFVDFHTGGWERMGFTLKGHELQRVLDASRTDEQAVIEQIVDAATTAQGVEYVDGSVVYQFHFGQVQFTGRRLPA